MTPNEIKLSRFGSSKIFWQKPEDMVLEQLALQLQNSAAANSEAVENSSRTPYFRIKNRVDDLDNPAVTQVVGDESIVTIAQNDSWPTIGVTTNSANNPSFFYFIEQYVGSDNMVIEADFHTLEIANGQDSKLGLAFYSEYEGESISGFLRTEANVAHARLVIQKGNTEVVSPVFPASQPDDDTYFTFRLERTKENIIFSFLRNGVIQGTLVYNQALMYGPALNAGAINNTAQGTGFYFPALVVYGLEVEIRRWETFVKKPVRSSLMLMGDENMQGYKVAYADSIAGLLSLSFPVTVATMTSPLLTQFISLNHDLMALQPKAALLFTGVHDILAAPESFAASFNPVYDELITRLTRQGILPIRVMLPPASVVNPLKIQELNNILVVDELSDYPLLDLWNSDLSTDPSNAATNAPNPIYYDADGWHLNAAGNAYVAEKILTEITAWNIDRAVVPAFTE